MPTSEPESPPIAPPSAEPAMRAMSVSAGWMSTESDMIFGEMNV